MAQLPASLSHAVAASPLRRRPVAILFFTLLMALLVAAVAGYAGWLGGQAAPVLRVFLLALFAAARAGGHWPGGAVVARSPRARRRGCSLGFFCSA